ncbi:hypothetical protein Patl1_36752 [Pistacia atlantica]|nr:hypothetical protein Patl1_36752 [Pistacia atlantica]
MAEEEAKPLAYLSETVLKKRESTESLALTRKAQRELGKYGKNNSKKKNDRPRRSERVPKKNPKELDLIRMKQRGKRAKSALVKPKSKLLFIIHIQGQNNMHPKTRKILYKLRLTKIFSGVFAMASERILEQLPKVEPYVTCG